MICKSMDTGKISREMYAKYFGMLSDTRKERICAMKTTEEKCKAVACEMIARQALHELTGAPEEGFDILTGINRVCVVSNYPVYFSLAEADGMLFCAANKKPIGIDCCKVEPFRFADASKLCTDIEIRHIFDASGRALAEVLAKNQSLTLPSEMQAYARVKALKDAYFTAIGRTFRNLREVSFTWENGTVHCSDDRYTGLSMVSDDKKIAYAVIWKKEAK